MCGTCRAVRSGNCSAERAEDLCEPPDSLLMRHAHEAALVKTIREAKGGGVRRRRCRPPAVHPPGHEGQNKDDRNRGYDRHD